MPDLTTEDGIPEITGFDVVTALPVMLVVSTRRTLAFAEEIITSHLKTELPSEACTNTSAFVEPLILAGEIHVLVIARAFFQLPAEHFKDEPGFACPISAGSIVATGALRSTTFD